MSRQLQKPLSAQRRRRKERITERFEEVYRVGMWGRDALATDGYCSGYGSRDVNITGPYVDAIRDFVAGKGRLDAVDLGCGDFVIGAQLRPLFGRYVACDVAASLIARNNEKFGSRDVDFRHLDITSDPLPEGDIAFCRQVLQHLSNADIRFFVRSLRDSGYRYFVLTEELPIGSFTPNGDTETGPYVRLDSKGNRGGVVLTEPPFDLAVQSAEILCDVSDGRSVYQTIVYTL